MHFRAIGIPQPQNPRGFRNDKKGEATALAASCIPTVVAALQIIRGTAPLPTNVEDQFRRAYGREMDELERKFYGLESDSDTRTVERQLPKAA